MNHAKVVTAGYEQLIGRFVEWAEPRPDIRAAVVIGSRARVDHQADEWSDLDILLFTSDPEPYVASAEWVRRIGTAWLTFTEQAGDGGAKERRVLYAGGLDVDFAIERVDRLEQLAGSSGPIAAPDVLARGTRVLIDKDGLLQRIIGAGFTSAQTLPPSNQAFADVVSNFWYHTLWTAKHLRRGEIWWAKAGCDIRLKELLLQMMEWHARARHGQSYDTWQRGRFLEEWADPRAVAQLPNTFAHYDEADIRRALLATMDLFRWLAVETAAKLGYPYLEEGDRETSLLVSEFVGHRTGPRSDRIVQHAGS